MIQTNPGVAVLLEMWNASSKKYTENVMSNMRLIREQRYAPAVNAVEKPSS